MEFEMKKRWEKKSARHITAALGLFLLQILLLTGATEVEARLDKANSLHQMKDPLPREIGVLKIMSVLQTKLGDQRLAEAAKSKLLLLDDGRLRLMSRLCDRVLLDGDTAGSDVAFLLLTMLIVLS